MRLTHQGRETRLDKPSRLIHPGDRLTFVLNARLHDLTVEGLDDASGLDKPYDAVALAKALGRI